MFATSPGRPESSEHDPSFARYVQRVPEEDILPTMRSQLQSTLTILRRVTPEQAFFRYAPEKWSIKEVVGHMADGEQVFGYRALCCSRNDSQPLPGFDENPYVAEAGFDAVRFDTILEHFEFARRSNIALFEALSEEAWKRSGIANGNPVSVRALAYILVGHERHHVNTLRERYNL